MNKLGKAKSLCAVVLCWLLLIQLASPLYAKAVQENVLVISKPQQLIDFSKGCTLDSFSKGLTVQLNSDLDMSNFEFSSIPIFYGSFDGQGHRISGLSIKAKGSEMGFFRSVEAGAIVKNLKLSATVAPQGSAVSVGILCGRNDGTISFCFVDGSVKGSTDVGAIAGNNSFSGILSSCKSDADVTGSTHTGGIAGYNHGLLENCTNTGSVNITAETQSSVPSLNDIASIGDTVNDIVSDVVFGNQTSGNKEETIKLGDITDTGGIAGRSSGIICGCVNSGTVGYNHVGYNIGGIVGTQNGIVSSCENRSEIFGRKDVGGIVGQFEPDIAIEFGGDNIAHLKEQLTGLNGTLKSLVNTMAKSVGSSLESAGSINLAVGVIEDTLKENGAVAGDDIKVTTDKVYPALQDINAASSKLISSIQAFTANVDAEMTIINSQLKIIGTALENAACTQERATITAEFEKINTSISNIASAAGNLETLITTLNTVLQDGVITAAEQQQLRDALAEYSKSLDTASISAELKNISASMKIINEQLKLINQKLDQSSSEIFAALKIIDPALLRLQQYITSFSMDVTTQLDIINKRMDVIEDVLYGYLGNAQDRLDKTFNTVYSQLNIINGNLAAIIADGTSANTSMNAILNTAINQIGDIGGTVSGMLDAPQYSAVDVSDDIETVVKPGQISVCRNTGKINADTNVGGIAGIMAIEAGNDPEEDFSMAEGLLGDTTALFRALIINSENSGAVTAKNGRCGGIVGRSDVGAIYKSNNLGDVFAGSSAYCGGIAGSARGSIIKCNALCGLFGQDYVGGIVGSGNNIANCRAMITIDSVGECVGAIGGDAEGELLENVFVGEGLAAVDGISYAGKAYPLPYSEFSKLAELPSFFTNLHLDFMVDGKLSKRIPFVYGGALDVSQIPSLPSHPDSFGNWEPFETENLLRNKVINAVYTTWISTISSGETKPLLLAEGKFSDLATLSISPCAGLPELGFWNRAVRSYDYSIEDSVRACQEEHTLHLLCDDIKGAKIVLTAGNKTKIIKAHQDGSYLVFTAPADGCITIAKPIISTVILLSCGGAMLVLLLLILILRHTKKFRKTSKRGGSHLKTAK